MQIETQEPALFRSTNARRVFWSGRIIELRGQLAIATMAKS
jgi:hypothetical protein